MKTKLSGKRTYIAIGIIFLLTLAYWQGWVTLPEKVGDALTTAAIGSVPLMFMRMGLGAKPKGP